MLTCLPASRRLGLQAPNRPVLELTKHPKQPLWHATDSCVTIISDRCRTPVKIVELFAEQEAEYLHMGCRRLDLVLQAMVLYSCVACTVVETSYAMPESVLRLFAIAEEEVSSCGPQVEIATPGCKVVETMGEYELRKYKKTEIWVETLVANSTFESATFTGFYRCFDFISGKNSQGMKIEMTSPIHITPALDANGYKVAFFVPSRFKTVKDLPSPQDPKVHFYQPKGAVKAVIGPFGGFPTDKDYEAKFAELKEALDKDGLKYDEKTVLYAGYSSPFQFRNRKQEVHVNIVA